MDRGKPLFPLSFAYPPHPTHVCLLLLLALTSPSAAAVCVHAGETQEEVSARKETFPWGAWLSTDIAAMAAGAQQQQHAISAAAGPSGEGDKVLAAPSAAPGLTLNWVMGLRTVLCVLILSGPWCMP